MEPRVSVPVVSFRSVVALVDRFPVLAGVDLHVEAGEVVLLTGANGAGKTSLLRAVAGLLPVAQGEATVLGHDLVADPRPVRRLVGFLGHGSALYGELTVDENVRFAVRAAAGDVARVPAALERLGLDGRLAAVPADRLSAGQRRRAALAVLLARDPALWLLDEPHASLDAGTRAELDAIVRDAAERGRTVLFSSHEGGRTHALATTAVAIEGGATASDDRYLFIPSGSLDVPVGGPTHVA